jgi:L-aminopeptidase/D-esterase-like protein
VTGANRTLTAIPGIAVGHATDREARTGCTAVLGPFRAAVDVRGLATGTRELAPLSHLHIVDRCDAILLTGGSAFGLGAADGVVRWLEERDRGFETPAARVPIVPTAVLYDLGVGDARTRPGPDMGYAAAEAASAAPVAEGSVGAGTGATVGKLLGPEGCDAGGIGSWCLAGERSVSALAAVNAFGDVVGVDGAIVAGARREGGAFLDTAAAIRDGMIRHRFSRPAAGTSTTLGVVATDVALDRTGLEIVARLAMNGLVRRISPCNTPFDGDVVFAVSTAPVADSSLSRGDAMEVGLRAQEALEHAVLRAVRAAAAGGTAQ